MDRDGYEMMFIEAMLSDDRDVLVLTNIDSSTEVAGIHSEGDYQGCGRKKSQVLPARSRTRSAKIWSADWQNGYGDYKACGRAGVFLRSIFGCPKWRFPFYEVSQWAVPTWKGEVEDSSDEEERDEDGDNGDRSNFYEFHEPSGRTSEEGNRICRLEMIFLASMTLEKQLQGRPLSKVERDLLHTRATARVERLPSSTFQRSRQFSTMRKLERKRNEKVNGGGEVGARKTRRAGKEKKQKKRGGKPRRISARNSGIEKRRRSE